MVVFHIDVNNAFLSWESVYRLTVLSESLDLRTIPSAIGGDKEQRHGIILAKSPPAKAFGIRTAETLGDALKKCPQLKIVPPHMDIYRQYSHQLMDLLGTYSDVVEQFSVDEAFVNMTGTELLFGPPLQAAETIRQQVKSELGFTVNIGISSNKLLAKMASDFEKPDKIHTLFPEEIPTKMWPLPVGELFFVGKASQKKMFNLGIRTIGELANADPRVLVAHMGKYGEMIHNYANGIDHSTFEPTPPDNKGYGNQTTLSHDVSDAHEAKQILLRLCESVGTRLRADGKTATVISVQMRDFHFANRSHQCTLPTPTNVTSEIYRYVCQLFDDYWDGTPLRLLGVASSKVGDNEARQLNLLDQDLYIRQGKLESAVDTIRERFGSDSIKRASFLSQDEEIE